jgi:carbonic anhydrase
MRLVEAILAANQRKLAGERDATVPMAEVASALPLAALTCIDVRLNRLLPDMLGVPEEQFVWLRNAGNIITGPLSSTTRSLALGCAVKGAKEIAIIGHSDCQVCKTTVMQLLERLNTLGVNRHQLPENLVEYFGLFGSERQNVIRGVETVRASALIGSKVPVHGLLIDIATGKIEQIVNGYDAPVTSLSGKPGEVLAKAEQTLDAFARLGNIASDELKLPTGKIGKVVSIAQDWVHKAEKAAAAVLPQAETAIAPPKSPTAPPLATAAATPTNPLATLQERMRRFSASTPPQSRPPKKR